MPNRLLPLVVLTLAAACGETRASARASKPADEQVVAPVQRESAAAAAVQREGILFAVSTYDDGTFGLEPVALVTRGGLRNPWDVESDSVFAARYFAPGTKYAVRVAGVPVGEASVDRVMEPGCNERFARASVSLTQTLPAQWDGLASDAFGAPAAQRLVRPLTPDEQNELATLADSIHAAHMIPSSARAAGENERLFAVIVPGAEGPVLVGTFNVTVPGDDETSHTYNQMLVAERRGGVYRPAYVWHDRDDGDNGVRSLLDAADLDGDGVPELVSRLMFNEGWGYAVLRRGADGWTEIYQGGGGGC